MGHYFPFLGASAGGGRGNSEDLVALRDLLVKAREETVKLQAEKDAVSGWEGSVSCIDLRSTFPETQG